MIYAIIFLLLVLLELAYFRVADRFDIIDKPNLRSSHTSVTLRGGGIVFLFGAWLYAAFFGLGYGWFLLGLTLIGLVSFTDDVHSLPDSLRLVVQFAAMFLMFHQFGILNWHDCWIVLIALIVCVGITNAYNFMDGINGITGGYSLAVLAPLIYLNSKMDFVEMPYLYVTGLSLLIFCFFNFRKRAKCFAGDVGSITIAFILLFALGKLILQTGDFAYIIFLAVYGADSILTICHRIQLHENLGQAHRKHAYQLMANELKIPHVQVSLLYMIIQLAISFGMIFCPINHYIYLGITILVLMAAYLIFMKKYYHLHEAYLKSKQLK
ncbi:MAG: glycosyltransferase family 4 protein [Bacteroides sp.]|nr:glycosyltransferase family 4 protein [Bacteroides sp.]MCM1476286.1 glycosyltransferase family 4 protein [Bacteroides sp.]